MSEVLQKRIGTTGTEELFQHSNKHVKIHGSLSSCLMRCLLPVRQVTCLLHLHKVGVTTAVANKTSAAPDLKNKKGQRSADDVTP